MINAYTAHHIELPADNSPRIQNAVLAGNLIVAVLTNGDVRKYDADKLATEDTAPVQDATSIFQSPVQLLAAVEELNLLIALASGSLKLLDLDSLDTLGELYSDKVTSFSFASFSNRSHSATEHRLIVVRNRKITIWTWGPFSDRKKPTSKEVSISSKSNISFVSWLDDTNITVATLDDFIIHNLSSEKSWHAELPRTQPKRSFDIGGFTSYFKSDETFSAISLLTGNVLLLRNSTGHLYKDPHSQIFRDKFDNPERRASPEILKWSEKVTSTYQFYPYLVTVVGKNVPTVEIRNPSSLTVLQTFTLPRNGMYHLGLVASGTASQLDRLIVWGAGGIWLLTSSKIETQIDALVEQGKFDEAQNLLELCGEDIVPKKGWIRRKIEREQGLSFLREGKYNNAIDAFMNSESHPKYLLPLYKSPIFDPIQAYHDHKKGDENEAQALKMWSFLFTDNGDSLPEKDLQTAAESLMLYLAAVHRKIEVVFLTPDGKIRVYQDEEDRLESSSVPRFHYLLENFDTDPPPPSSYNRLLLESAELIDTAMFCVDMFLGARSIRIFGRNANWCNENIVQYNLSSKGLHGQLVQFLTNKKSYRAALEYLSELGHSESADIPAEFRGPKRIVEYLKSVPWEHVDLILEFSRWPLEIVPELTMSFFLDKVAPLPDSNRAILTFLAGYGNKFAIPFLQKLVSTPNVAAEFHDKMVEFYLSDLRSLGAGSVEFVRRLAELERFLATASSPYSPTSALALVPDGPAFQDCRIILFRRMGRHGAALEIFLFGKSDLAGAERYCQEVYDGATAGWSDWQQPDGASSSGQAVYETLLALLASPPPPHRPDQAAAIRLANRVGHRLPSKETLALLPEQLPLASVEPYLRSRLRADIAHRNRLLLLASVEAVDRDSARTRLELDERAKAVQVTSQTNCSLRECGKPLLDSRICITPDMKLVHLGCLYKLDKEKRRWS